MTRQQAIMEAMADVLKGITKANDFLTDIGKKVREWEIGADEDDLPFVDVRDTDEVTATVHGAHVWDMPLTIIVGCAGQTSRVEARKMTADVYKAIGKYPTLKGLADRIRPSTHKLQSVQGKSLVTAVIIKVVVTYSTDPWASN